jgi:hypothetical protein
MKRSSKQGGFHDPQKFESDGRRRLLAAVLMGAGPASAQGKKVVLAIQAFRRSFR